MYVMWLAAVVPGSGPLTGLPRRRSILLVSVEGELDGGDEAADG